MKKYFTILTVILIVNSGFSQKNDLKNNKWTIEKATKWYNGNKWIIGANFVPSTAINQLEMWQESTFDSKTIDIELKYAENIGFNTMRVYLHSLAYKADPKGFKSRMNKYLQIAAAHNIKTIFVIFDDVWDKSPKIGKQPEPKPGTHNSGWVQDPGDPASRDVANFPNLEIYVKDIVGTYKDDKRILMWDLYNEPGNSDKFSASVALLKKVFVWARAVHPSQPLTDSRSISHLG